MESKSCDVAVVGAGSAGLMAAVYAQRYKMKTIVFGDLYGGTITTAHRVANFPGFTDIGGLELGQKMYEQAKANNVQFENELVTAIKKNGDSFELSTAQGIFTAKKVILAMGTKRRKLGLPREEELLGKGVSYCATCDGLFFMDKVVAVVGGSDSALTIALYLADVATKVYVIYRKGAFRAEPVWVDLVAQNKKIVPVFNANVKELLGKPNLTGVKLDTGKIIDLEGLFIEIGSDPQKEFYNSFGVQTNDAGYVLVDKHMRTSVPGIYSAGDINADNFKQAVVAVAEGSIAANTAFEDSKAGMKKK